MSVKPARQQQFRTCNWESGARAAGEAMQSQEAHVL
jgi:hypothetical protein